MAKDPKETGSSNLDRLIAETRRERERRMTGYRERALRLFPHVCARCGREFSGKNLRQLTVHHKDHNHDFNPPDGSNWELLCLYCHDDEHSRLESAARYDGVVPESAAPASDTFRPFADLENLLKGKK